MGNRIAYLRASTDKQDLQNQRYEILEYANQHGLRIDEWVDVTISSRKTTKQRRIEELLEKLADADTLIVTELSRLGRSTAEVIDLLSGQPAEDWELLFHTDELRRLYNELVRLRSTLPRV